MYRRVAGLALRHRGALAGVRRALLSAAAAASSERVHLGEFDYVIVGGGSAGCVLANRLSADPRVSVCVLEAGGSDLYHWVHIPVGYVYTMRYPQHRTNWGFQTVPQPGLGGRAIFYPRGKLLGGSGSINGMIAMRGQAEDYDAWAAAADDPSWAWAAMRPHFERLMDYTAGDPTLPDGSRLGVGGPLEVTRQALQWPVLDQWADACAASGLPRRSHFIDSQRAGVGYFEVTQKQVRPGRGGVRLSPYRAFLAPILADRPNLTIMPNAHAARIVIERDGDAAAPAATARRSGGGSDLAASGVELWLRPAEDTPASYARAVAVDAGLVKGRRDRVVDKAADRPALVTARREVLLAAGAINSPHLLQVSGVGPGEALARHRVPVLVDAPGVGSNLQDHLQLRAVWRLADGTDTLNTRLSSPWGMIKTALEYAYDRSGPMAMAPSQLGVFAKSSDAVATPDLQWHVQPLSLDSWEEPLHPWPGLTASVCHLRPTSRGCIALASRDARDAPDIDPNYLSTDEDRAVAAKAMRITRTIAAALDPALRAAEHVPGLEHETDAQLAAAAGRIGTSIFHPAGTTRLGRDGDPEAVLDARLRVRDGAAGAVVRGLRVVDCGSMPTITSGNTNLPTYAIAEKASIMILEDAARHD